MHNLDKQKTAQIRIPLVASVMTKGLKIFLLTILTLTAVGQSKRNRTISTCFLDFDKVVTLDSIGAQIRTDKIYFNDNNDLDTIKSKLTLDSIIWFFKKHTDLACEVTLTKGDEILREKYRNTEIGFQQTKQIESYLYHRLDMTGILVTEFIVCGQLVLTDEESKKLKSGTANSDKTLRLNLFIFDKRRPDPKAAK